MSAQRATPAVPAASRGIHPDLPGLPWWSAILLAVAASTAGILIDAVKGGNELTGIFAGFYVVGCVAAVLTVVQSGVFSTVVQPPLILFVAVPSAYYVFHYSEINGIKDILINCGYPLIERFTLMFYTSVAVLLIGIARWFFGSAKRTGRATASSSTKEPTGAGRFASIRATLTGGKAEPSRDDDADDAEVAEPRRTRTPRKHRIDRPSTASTDSPTSSSRPARERRPARDAAARSRHARPPMDDLDGPAAEPRRRRSRPVRDDEDAAVPSPPRRRRPPRDLDPQREPREPRDYPRAPREQWAPSDPADRPSRRPSRYDAYEPVDSYEPPPRRTSSTDSTRLPFSNVRYRGPAEDGEDRAEYRRAPRSGRHHRDSDDWRYQR